MWYDDLVVNHVAFCPFCGQLCLVSRLDVIRLESFRELNDGLPDQLQVTCSADDYTDGYRVACLHLFFI